jgi:hypothetical protein
MSIESDTVNTIKNVAALRWNVPPQDARGQRCSAVQRGCLA